MGADGLYQFSAHTSRGWVVAGAIVERGRVVLCAPYLRKMFLNRKISDVLYHTRMAMFWKVEYLGL